MIVATCSSCGARIFWAVTAMNGKSMPVNAEPDTDGNLDIQPAADPRDPPIAHILEKHGRHRIPAGMQPRGFVRHMAHWATCPNADLHRKPKAQS